MYVIDHEHRRDHAVVHFSGALDWEPATALTVVLNLMAGEHWRIDADLAAGRWVSAATHILRRVRSVVPGSSLRVLDAPPVDNAKDEFFSKEGTRLLRDILAFILMVTSASAPAPREWVRYPRRHRRSETSRSKTRAPATRSRDGFGGGETHRSWSVARSSGKTARYWPGNGLQTRRRYARRGLRALNVILGTNLPMTPIPTTKLYVDNVFTECVDS